MKSIYDVFKTHEDIKFTPINNDISKELKVLGMLYDLYSTGVNKEMLDRHVDNYLELIYKKLNNKQNEIIV